ncbi:MAG: hypothetical protein GYB64_04815 [Chloroflexi bacterium]|nr:hypothetical protein [Chloroflexota bacterium]
MTQATVPVPDLRIVPVAAITPHEAGDSQRAKPLSEALVHDGFIRNPIIITPHEDGYILLDGTNRHGALQHLSIPHAFAQVVDYDSPHVSLSTWTHVIADVPAAEVYDTVAAIPNLFMRTAPSNPDVAVLTLRDGRTLYLRSASGTYTARIEALRTLVETLIGVGRLNRSGSNAEQDINDAFPDWTAVVRYMHFTPDDVRRIITLNVFAPAGVTRHIVQGRALRVNVPMDLLRADMPLAEKNKQLHNEIHTKFAQRQVRLYTEATYVYEE